MIIVAIVSFCLALAIGCPHDKVPYSRLKLDNLLGWPPSVKVCHPSLLSDKDARQLYENIDSIKFVGKFNAHN